MYTVAVMVFILITLVGKLLLRAIFLQILLNPYHHPLHFLALHRHGSPTMSATMQLREKNILLTMRDSAS
ncbi:hypothetical protein DV532_13260 [Pseudomonas sp. Leaf58]|nr:hypothetical protein DV532_13260 [Pseudomonas sp. Leaf58]KQN59243.1 hypothetical protein ASF02_20520 [Pseudomonas sp. Leaf58]